MVITPTSRQSGTARTKPGVGITGTAHGYGAGEGKRNQIPLDGGGGDVFGFTYSQATQSAPEFFHSRAKPQQQQQFPGLMNNIKYPQQQPRGTSGVNGTARCTSGSHQTVTKPTSTSVKAPKSYPKRHSLLLKTNPSRLPPHANAQMQNPPQDPPRPARESQVLRLVWRLCVRVVRHVA